MKNVKEYLLEVLDAELPKFIRVFEALPQDKLDWKPDPKSRSAAELASVMADETGQLVSIIETGILDYATYQPTILNNTAEIAQKFKAGLEKVKTLVASMTEEAWESEAKMLMGETESWKTTRGDMTWGFLFDLIHHRGQLATYIRPMGGKVPSIYGPSADTNE